MASQDSAGEIRFWSLASGKELPLRVLQAGDSLLVGFDRAGSRLLTRSGGKEGLSELRLWDLDGPPDAEAVLMRRDFSWMNDIEFDPTGRWLV